MVLGRHSPFFEVARLRLVRPSLALFEKTKLESFIPISTCRLLLNDKARPSHNHRYWYALTVSEELSHANFFS